MKNIVDFYPLSPMQQGMLFHSRLEPGSGVYVEQMSCRLEGDLDLPAFERAWQAVVQRHPILRTAFIGEGLKEPVQAVHRQVPLAILQQDWTGASPQEQQTRLAGYLQEDRTCGFDLSRPPLLRLSLLRLGASDWRLVWSFHHILLDGWSIPILFQEVFTAYAVLARGRDPVFPVARPYRDYITWLRGQDRASAESYWRKTLSAFTAPTPLPEDWAAERGSLPGQASMELERWLSPQQTRQLTSFAQQQRLTLNTLVQAAWGVLLGRYSREEDVLFGATVSGRPPDLPGAEEMVGLFINTLPVRVRLSPDARVADWLRDLQAGVVEMRQYEYCSLVDIQGWSEVPRGRPLFESLLVFENYPIQAAVQNLDTPLRLSDLRSDEQTNYPLNLIAGASDRLMLKIVFDPQRYTAGTVNSMLDQLVLILTGMAAAPGAPLRDLPLLDPAEKTPYWLEWNRADTDYDLERVFPSFFADQAARTPQALALQFEDQSMTYAELDARSNRLARALSRLGVGTESLVAVCMEPSLEVVTAILGVLKAGGAYLPLDPAYPADRLEFMLADSQAVLVLTQQKIAPLVPGSPAQVICLDAEWDALSQESDAHFSCPAGPHNLAYVIYTSGSTGRPKGVLLQHRGMSNLIQTLISLFEVHPGSRVLQFASLSFDGSVTEIFPTLAAGASLVLAPRQVLASVPDLSRLLRGQGVTHASFPPSLLSLLDPRECPALSNVVSAGEACPPEVARRWCVGRRMFNGYGPTETTVAASYDRVVDLPENALRVPIGRPLPNTRVMVLDPWQRPVPVGVPGELHVAGVSLARGYLNRPELTAQKFIRDPFSPDPAARLYRTGDLARWRPDGRLEFLGRLDDQVKVRGFRIELGEIEAVLGQYPDLQSAVVAVRPDRRDPDDPQSRQLVAYVVPNPGFVPELGQIRAFLNNRLPDYMLPNALVRLDALPLNPNGKVDRRRLLTLDAGPDPARQIVEPRDLFEASLRQVWEEVLAVHPLGVRDNFFDLGGHSLLAVRLMARVKDRLGIDFSLADLFQAPTVEQLAARLRLQDTANPSLLVPIQTGGSKPPLVFIHPSGGSVHWYADLAEALGPDQPFYAFQARGLHGGQDLHDRIEDMAAAYLSELRAFQPEGPYRLGSWSMGVVIAYEMACQLVEQGQAVALLGILDQGPTLPAAEPEDSAAYLVEVFGQQIPLSLAELRQQPEEGQVRLVWEQARQANFIYPDLSLEQFRGFIHILRTHTEAWRRYRPRRYPGRLVLFRAADQQHAEPEPDLGWAALASAGVAVHTVPGDHLTMIHPPHVAALAREIQACLDLETQ